MPISAIIAPFSGLPRYKNGLKCADTSLIFLILGLINSKILTPLNKIWFKFGILLGKIVSPIVMGLIFFLVVTPIAIFMKILKKDLLNLRYNNDKSYWIEKNEPKSKMKNQF